MKFVKKKIKYTTFFKIANKFLIVVENCEQKFKPKTIFKIHEYFLNEIIC